jgi:hypothetical protein
MTTSAAALNNTSIGDAIYSNSLTSGLNILKPDVRNKLYPAYGAQGRLWQKMMDLGDK